MDIGFLSILCVCVFGGGGGGGGGMWLSSAYYGENGETDFDEIFMTSWHNTRDNFTNLFYLQTIKC